MPYVTRLGPAVNAPEKPVGIFVPPGWEETLSYLTAVKTGSVALRIPVKNGHGEVVGALVPLTVEHLGDGDLIETFVRWRNQNREGWLDQRPVTPEATRRWLEAVVRVPNRMSFLILWGDRPVGRCGFLNLTPEDNESDGLVRGERGGGYHFMRDAQIAGICWKFERLGISSIWSKVLSTNERAQASCESLGYRMEPFDSRPVYRQHYPDGNVLTEEGDGELCPDLRILYLRLTREGFYNSLKYSSGS